jgi:hypothetical protein
MPVGVAAAASAFAQRDASKIRIIGLEIFLVHVNNRGNWILARLSTSEGLTESVRHCTALRIRRLSNI